MPGAVPDRRQNAPEIRRQILRGSPVLSAAYGIVFAAAIGFR